ncbi:MAG: hypothetical protein AAB728_01255 [Patescibacteria group bacterium]
MRLRTAFRPIVVALFLAGNASVFAQGALQDFTSQNFRFSFQYPDSYTKTAVTADWREEIALQRDGELALVVSFLSLGQDDQAVLTFPELLQTKGTILCQQMCVIELLEEMEANGIQGMRFSLKTRASSGSALLVNPFPGTSLYAFNVHPGSSDLLFLTPVVDESQEALQSVLSTLTVPDASAAEEASAASLPSGETPPALPPAEEQLLFGLFSTQLSVTQYVALCIALVCLVIFIALRIREKKLASGSAPAFYQPKP